MTLIFYILLVAWLGICVSSLFRPELGLVLVFSLYAVEQILYFGLPGLIPTSGVKFAVGVSTLAAVIVSIARGRADTKSLPRIFMLTFAFFVYVITATLWGPDQPVQVEWFRKYAPYAITFWFLAPFCLNQQVKLSWLFAVLTYFGGLVFVAYMFCDVGSRGIIVEIGRQDITMNPLQLATYAAVTITAITFSLYHSKSSKILLVLKAVITALCLYAIVRGGSRGQFFALLASLLIWLPLTVNISLRKSLIIPMSICLVIIGVAVQFVMTYGEQYGGGRWKLAGLQDSADIRLEMVSTALESYGSGGAFTWFFGLGYAAVREIIGIYPHNVPIEILSELGLFGFGVYLMIILGTIRLGWGLLKSAHLTSDERITIGFTMCIFTLVTLLSLKEGTYMRGDTFLASNMIGWVALRYSRRQFGLPNLPSRISARVTTAR